MFQDHDGWYRIPARLYEATFLFLPEPFRGLYGEEIRAFHRDRMNDLGRSSLDRFALWVAAVWDVMWGGLLERGRHAASAVARRRVRGGWGRGVSEPGGPELGGRGGKSVDTRRTSPGLWLDLLLQDLRFAMRGLARTKGFTAVAVLSLALGVGVFTGVFSLFHQTWLKPVPGVPEPERVVELLTKNGSGGELEAVSYPDFQDLREAETPVEEWAGWKDRSGTLNTAGGGERVRLMYVSSNYFRVLGVVPRRGRAFLPDEDVGPGQHPVAVVSYGFWMDRLGGDPGIVGRSLTLNRSPYTVVGVAPPEFRGHRVQGEEPEVWLPLAQDPWVAGTDSWTRDRAPLWLRVLGRLREGATVEETNAALATVFGRLAELHPETNERRGARAHSFGPVPAQGRAASMVAVSMLFGLMTLVLLIICGNVTGMVLARSVSRERELAVRAALGSGRARLARLLMMEALVLAGAGGGLGLFLGIWGLGVAYALVPGMPPMTFGVEGSVLRFALILTFAVTVVVGLLPALRFSRPELVSSLKDDSGGGGRRVGRIHRVAASAQAGITLVLLVTSGMFLRALGVMEERDLGFEPRGLLTVGMDVHQEGYETQDVAEPFLDGVKGALEEIPGVASVSVADGIPLDLVGNFTSVSRADLPEEGAGRVQVEFTRVGEDYFETIGTPVLRGRGIERTDDSSSEPVLVLTESLAARLWPGEEVLGRRVRSRVMRGGPEVFTVVGVVPEVASSRSTESWPNIFVAARQNYRSRIMITIRGTGDLETLNRPIQSAILGVDPGLSFPTVVPSESLVAQSTQAQRSSAGIAGALGVLALLLSAIGVYGVVAFAVTSRTREIGLRMAVGASRKKVLWDVLRDAVRLAVPGLAVGVVLSTCAAAGFRSELFGLSPLDPVSFGAAAGLLFLVILFASLVPARRASGIDPMEALRSE